MSFLLPESGLLFWMLIAFGVVFFILYKYGFPVITSMIDERKKFIDDALHNAKLANEKLAGIEEQSRQILEKANAEQVKILREAVVVRDNIIKEAHEKAEAESARIVATAREQLRQEKDEALDNAKLANEKLAGIEEQSRQILEKANAEQVKILREAVVVRDNIIKDAQEKAEAESARIVATAREQIRQEKEEALREIRAQVAELSLSIAEKVIRKELSNGNVNDKYMNTLLDEAFADPKGKK